MLSWVSLSLIGETNMSATSRLIILLFELDNVTHESYILLGKKGDGIFKTVCSKGSYISMSDTHSDRIIRQVSKHIVMYVYKSQMFPQRFELLALLSEFDELQWVNVNKIVDSASNQTDASYVTLTDGLKVAKYVAHLLVNA